MPVLRVAQLLVCLLMLCAGARVCALPLDGKGVFIKNLRAYQLDPTTDPELGAGLDRFMQKVVYSAQIPCQKTGSADTTCTLLRAINLPPPGGFGIRNGVSVASYTEQQMFDFLTTSPLQLDWIAIKGLDGVSTNSQFHSFARRFNANTSPTLLAYVVLRPSIAGHTPAEAGGAQAARLKEVATLYKENLSGVIIMPGYDITSTGPDNGDSYNKTEMIIVVQAFLDSMRNGMPLPMAYSPMAAFNWNCQGGGNVPNDQIVHRMLQTSDLMTTVVPRCFWMANRRPEQSNPASGPKRVRVVEYLKNAVYPWLYRPAALPDAVTSKPVVALGQAEYKEGGYGEVRDFGNFVRHYGLKVPQAHRTLRGVGFWCLDEFTLQDLVQFSQIDMTEPTPPDAYNLTDLPTFMQEAGCHNPWIPGFMPKNLIGRTLEYYLEKLRNEPPKCVP